MAGGNPIRNQATWRLAGPGKDSYIGFPDWSDGVTSANAKKKKKKKKTPNAPTSQIGCRFLPCNSSFGIVTVLLVSAMVASWHPTGAALAEGRSRTSSCNPAQTNASMTHCDTRGGKSLLRSRDHWRQVQL